MAYEYRTPILSGLRLRFAYNTTDISTGVLIGTVPVGASIMSLTVDVDVAFNAGTSNLINAGFAGTGVEWIASTSVGAAGMIRPYAFLSTTQPLVANRDVYVRYQQTGAAASVGSALFSLIYML